MEILMYGVRHRVVHDIESAFYVLLFICTRTSKGPTMIFLTLPSLGKMPTSPSTLLP